jgi:RNA polymerase sigma-70 factor, ECF subfamily
VVSGGPRSFDGFYEENYASVCRALAAGLGITQESAEEAAQEAFVRALVRWRRVAKMERASGWVYVTAVRVAIRRRPDAVGEFVPETRTAVTDSVDDGLMLTNAIGRLPDRQRLAVVLRYYADLELTVIATAMDCAVGTVKSTLHTALRRLEVELDDDYAKEP